MITNFIKYIKMIFQDINKKAQEEIIGFALILVIVGIILLILVGFYINNNSNESIESYETESFLQAFLQYTSDCRDQNNLEYITIQKLIMSCEEDDLCLDGKNTCSVLNSTSKEIIETSWGVEEGNNIKGYVLGIKSETKEILSLQDGNVTGNYKGAVVEFSKRGNSIILDFEVYS